MKNQVIPFSLGSPNFLFIDPPFLFLCMKNWWNIYCINDSWIWIFKKFLIFLKNGVSYMWNMPFLGHNFTENIGIKRIDK